MQSSWSDDFAAELYLPGPPLQKEEALSLFSNVECAADGFTSSDSSSTDVSGSKPKSAAYCVDRWAPQAGFLHSRLQHTAQNQGPSLVMSSLANRSSPSSRSPIVKTQTNSHSEQLQPPFCVEMGGYASKYPSSPSLRSPIVKKKTSAHSVEAPFSVETGGCASSTLYDNRLEMSFSVESLDYVNAAFIFH